MVTCHNHLCFKKFYFIVQIQPQAYFYHITIFIHELYPKLDNISTDGIKKPKFVCLTLIQTIKHDHTFIIDPLNLHLFNLTYETNNYTQSLNLSSSNVVPKTIKIKLFNKTLKNLNPKLKFPPMPFKKNTSLFHTKKNFKPSSMSKLQPSILFLQSWN